MLAKLFRSLRDCRVRGLLCCFLTLFATYDSYLFAACAPACSIANAQNNSPFQDDDDDDEMLDTSLTTARGQALSKEARLPADHLGAWIAAQVRLLDFCARPPITRAALRCEHEHRNGLGAPLLC
jgi:hypothetical protein